MPEESKIIPSGVERRVSSGCHSELLGQTMPQIEFGMYVDGTMRWTQNFLYSILRI